MTTPRPTTDSKYSPPGDMAALLMRMVGDAILLLDAEQRIIGCNEAAQRFYGVSEEQALGQPQSALYTIDWLEPEGERAAQAALQEAGSWRGVQRQRMRSGDQRTVEVAIQLLPQASGASAAALLVIRDLTERMALEAARDEERQRQEASNEFRFRKALDNSTVTVFTQDQQLRYTWIYNPMPGYSVDQIIGRTDAELFERPEDVMSLDAVKRQALESGAEVRCEVSLHVGNQEYCYDLIVEPLLSDDGQAIGVICTAVDISEQKQVEGQLQRGVEQLQLALTALDGFIYDYDLLTSQVERSEGLTHLLGYQLDEIPAHAEWWGTLIHPEDVGQIQVIGRRGLDVSDSYSQEYRVRHKDGHYIHIWDRAIVIRDAHGNATRLIGTTINLTERRQAEERQRYLADVSKVLADSIEYEARLPDLVRLTVDSIADWCVINLLTEHGQIQAVAWAHRDPDKERLLYELAQRYPIDPAWSHGTPYVLRTGQSQWYPLLNDALMQVDRMEDHERELWRAIGYHSLMIVPMIRQGNVIGTFTLMLGSPDRSYTHDDVVLAELTARRVMLAIENARLYRLERTAREEAEKAAERAAFLNDSGGALSESMEYTERLSMIVRFAVPRFCDVCVLFLCSPDGLIHRAAAAHSDAEKESWLTSFRELEPIGPESSHPAAAAIRMGKTLINPDVTVSLEQLVATQALHAAVAPKLVPHDHVVVPLVARQSVLGAISFGMDQSSRTFSREDIATAEILTSRAALMIDNARLYRDQQEAVTVRDAFLLIASHELKTPLTAVLGQAQLLQQRLAQSGAASERDARALRVIVEQSQRLNKLISNLLDVSRLSQGQLQIVREPVLLNTLIRRIVGDFQPLLVQHTLVYQESDQELVVEGDALRLEQMLQNLLQNARKYSPQGGTISVILESRGSQALITVSDRGIGIPQDALPNLFQRFYRVESAASQHMSGIGVGLYVVHEIVKLHGGSVYVESTEGQGSSFVVMLPLVETEGRM